MTKDDLEYWRKEITQSITGNYARMAENRKGGPANDVPDEERDEELSALNEICDLALKKLK